MIYLASPYSHNDPLVRQIRYDLTIEAMATLVQSGKVIFSPIVHSHPVDVALMKRGIFFGSAYWVKYAEPMMAACDSYMILKIDGWETSSGIKREVEYFRQHGIPYVGSCL